MICHRKGIEVFDALRYFLAESVSRYTFDWLPLDGSGPNKGYMPYASIAEVIESARLLFGKRQAL